MADVRVRLGIRRTGKTAWLVDLFEREAPQHNDYIVVVDARTRGQRTALMARLGNPLGTYTLRQVMMMTVSDERPFALYLDEYEYFDDERWAFVMQLRDASTNRIRAASTPGPKHTRRLLL